MAYLQICSGIYKKEINIFTFYYCLKDTNEESKNSHKWELVPNVKKDVMPMLSQEFMVWTVTFLEFSY